MMYSKVKKIVLLFTTYGLVLSCGTAEKGKNKMIDIDRVSASEWNIFEQKHVVFGHRSVGKNILSGVQSLANKAGVKLQVTESRSTMTSSGITHFEIGQNESPNSKLKDFEVVFNSERLQRVDIALMKLCYIDINQGTDAKKLAVEYIATLDRLSSKFPDTTFVAVTTPLTTVQSGPKAWVKWLLGRTPSGYVENYRRLEFNNFLRNNYGRQGRLFDLAKIEAIGASSYQYQGYAVEALNPDITSDGGHLNPLGEQVVAAKLVKYIAALPN